jgi:hypothetical protein
MSAPGGAVATIHFSICGSVRCRLVPLDSAIGPLPPPV